MRNYSCLCLISLSKTLSGSVSSSVSDQKSSYVLYLSLCGINTPQITI